VLAQIALLPVDTVVAFFVFVLLARFHFQWLRVPFHNPLGEFIVVTTNWCVRPARRFIPGLAGLDLPTLLLAWLVQGLGLLAQASIVGAAPGIAALAAVAAVDLLRYSIYILIFAVIVQVVFSWLNPHAPMAPLFDMVTRPFLRPLRRFIPPLGSFDLTPLVLLVAAQVALIPIGHLRAVAAGW
jgi:YggT family protein